MLNATLLYEVINIYMFAVSFNSYKPLYRLAYCFINLRASYTCLDTSTQNSEHSRCVNVSDNELLKADY